jgi:hypothetical protein
MTSLLGDESLERSAVVANCRMNRERNLLGTNGYDRELGFNPIDFLKERADDGLTVTWVDLCFGTGRALIEAARIVHDEGLAPHRLLQSSVRQAIPLDVYRSAADCEASGVRPGKRTKVATGLVSWTINCES